MHGTEALFSRLLIIGQSKNINLATVFEYERERHATGVCAGTYNLAITSPLPNREVIMKSNANKILLSRLLCTCTLVPNMLKVGEDEGMFNHEKAAMLTVSFMIGVVRYGKMVIRILSDDADVFVILIFWVRKLSTKAPVQMEKWDGIVLPSIPSWLFSGIEASSFLDCTPPPVNIQCRIPSTRKSSPHSANSEKETSQNYVVGEETAILEDLLKTGQTFFAALHGQPKSTSLNTVRYTIYTKKKGNPPLAKSLPPTDKNLLRHILRTHHQTIFRKAVEKQVAPAILITDFRWEVLNNIPSPVIPSGLPAPLQLMKVISGQCIAAQGKCICFAASLSCITYSRCTGSQDECHNPLTKKYDDATSDD